MCCNTQTNTSEQVAQLLTSQHKHQHPIPDQNKSFCTSEAGVPPEERPTNPHHRSADVHKLYMVQGLWTHPSSVALQPVLTYTLLHNCALDDLRPSTTSSNQPASSDLQPAATATAAAAAAAAVAPAATATAAAAAAASEDLEANQEAHQEA
jgi:hypothetical protein